MSTEVVIISIIAIIAILSGAGNMQLEEDFVEDTPVVQGRCPPFGTMDFIVTVRGEKFLMDKSCASLDRSKYNSLMVKSLSIWFGRLGSGISSCRGPNLKRMRFSCMESHTKVNYKNESLYIRLYGRVTQPVAKPKIRCALFKMIKNNHMDYNMAISNNRSCNGLPAMLSSPFPQGPDGSMLLRVMRPGVP